MKKLLLIRHAQCEMNAYNSSKLMNEKILGGGGPLTQRGIKQSEELGKYFLLAFPKLPDFVACSSSERAKQTLENSIWYPKMKYTLDSRLNEQSKGIWEGERHGYVITNQVVKDMSWHYSPIRGESRENVKERGMEFLEEKVFGFDYGISAIFSHQNFIRNIVTELFGLEKEEAFMMKVANAAIFEVHYEGRQGLDLEVHYLDSKKYKSIKAELGGDKNVTC
jgi:broad specificity phosphatase PhoE